MAAAAAMALSAVRPVTQTFAPARHNSIAAARPMPEVPPMTTAFCSSSISFSMLTEASHPVPDKIDDDGIVRQNYIVQSISWLVIGLSKRTPASTKILARSSIG